MMSRTEGFGIDDKAWPQAGLKLYCTHHNADNSALPDGLIATTADIAQKFCADLVAGSPYDFVSAFL